MFQKLCASLFVLAFGVTLVSAQTASRRTMDYDGDGKTDYALFRPAEGKWHVLKSSNFSEALLQFGAIGDIPVPGDYDGDGITDHAVFRPSNGSW